MGLIPMGRFFVVTGFLVVIFGAMIHFKVDVPWLTAWIGKLPGDLIIRKGKIVIYLPFATSVLASVVLSSVSSIFFGNRK